MVRCLLRCGKKPHLTATSATMGPIGSVYCNKFKPPVFASTFSSTPTPPSSTGLVGVVAGQTSITRSTDQDLFYRGYSIHELTKHSQFEEVAFLLLYGHLPSALQLQKFQKRLCEARAIPSPILQILEALPANAHPMDILRTYCSLLGTFDTDRFLSTPQEIATHLIGSYASALLYWYHYSHSGIRVQVMPEVLDKKDSIAEHFLKLMHIQNPLRKFEPMHIRALDIALTLYAEHDFNASTFASRVTSSTKSDIYSAITSGIGTLRGPLHGGANEAAMDLVESIPDITQVPIMLDEMIDKKQKFMGFGHRMYKSGDPRSHVMKIISESLSKSEKSQTDLHKKFEAIEKHVFARKKLYPNVDFYSASTFHQLGIPTCLFTPIFVIGRTAGWAAHVIEQYETNKLIRPTSVYVGPPSLAFIPLQSRQELTETTSKM